MAQAAVAVGTVEEREIVRLFAEADRLEREAKKLKERARGAALELFEDEGLASLVGDEGTVIIAQKKGAERLDSRLLRRILSAEQVAACTVVGEPSVSVTFKPRKVA